MNELAIAYTLSHPAAKPPLRANQTDAGYDLFAVESVSLNPGERALIKTGVSMHIPDGFYGRVAPRSGLALKHGLATMAGVVDSGYLGEVGVLLINHGEGFFHVEVGMRVGQIIIERCHDVKWTHVETLGETARGAGGYGSSGT